jgi:hypothetical protein
MSDVKGQVVVREAKGKNGMNGDALAVRERGGELVAQSLPSIAELEHQFALATRQRDLLEQYIRDRLKEDKHFYTIGNAKPGLTKEGAELVCLPHGLVPDYEIVSGPSMPPVDMTQRYQIVVKCTLLKGGLFAGSGIGSASNYHFSQKKGLIPRQANDPGLCHNSTLKMAQKSAYIAATLNATAASEFFTQDMEEVRAEAGETAKAPPPRCPKCNGSMWDNRDKKASGAHKPNAPDFKCKKKECGEGVWLNNGNAQGMPAEEEAPPDKRDPRTKLNAALHGTYSHDLLHRHAVKLGLESWGDATLEHMQTVDKHLERQQDDDRRVDCSACTGEIPDADDTFYQGELVEGHASVDVDQMTYDELASEIAEYAERDEVKKKYASIRLGLGMAQNFHLAKALNLKGPEQSSDTIIASMRELLAWIRGGAA